MAEQKLHPVIPAADLPVCSVPAGQARTPAAAIAWFLEHRRAPSCDPRRLRAFPKEAR